MTAYVKFANRCWWDSFRTEYIDQCATLSEAVRTAAHWIRDESEHFTYDRITITTADGMVVREWVWETLDPDSKPMWVPQEKWNVPN